MPALASPMLPFAAMRATPFRSRRRLTARDLTFLVEALGCSDAQQNALLHLLADETEADRLLDDERLLAALLDDPRPIELSLPLYFYILVRHAFRQAGLKDRDLADYVASALAEFAQQDRHEPPFRDPGAAMLYSIDFALAADRAEAYARFFLYAYAGNYYLVMTSLFPGFLEQQSERRGAPPLDYYEGVGAQAFRTARDHPLAREFEVAEVYDTLAQSFSVTRRLLNGCAERLLFLN